MSGLFYSNNAFSGLLTGYLSGSSLISENSSVTTTMNASAYGSLASGYAFESSVQVTSLLVSQTVANTRGVLLNLLANSSLSIYNASLALVLNASQQVGVLVGSTASSSSGLTA